MEWLTLGTAGACPSKKQQLESIKNWPGQSISERSPVTACMAYSVAKKPPPPPPPAIVSHLTKRQHHSFPWKVGRTAGLKRNIFLGQAKHLSVWVRAHIHRVHDCTQGMRDTEWISSSAAPSPGQAMGLLRPTHMCTGQMLWHLQRGQRACCSYYTSPLGKQSEEKYLAIWKEARFQNGLFLCDSLPCTDEREGLWQIFITRK